MGGAGQSPQRHTPPLADRVTELLHPPHPTTCPHFPWAPPMPAKRRAGQTSPPEVTELGAPKDHRGAFLPQGGPGGRGRDQLPRGVSTMASTVCAEPGSPHPPGALGHPTIFPLLLQAARGVFLNINLTLAPPCLKPSYASEREQSPPALPSLARGPLHPSGSSSKQALLWPQSILACCSLPGSVFPSSYLGFTCCNFSAESLTSCNRAFKVPGEP